MKNLFFLITLNCVLAGQLFAGPEVWSTAEISVAPSSGVNVDVIVGSGPNSGNVTAVWGDINTYAPYYSIYNNGTWTTGAIPLVVSGGVDSVGVYDNIYVVQGPNQGNLIAAWVDANLEFPYFSFYNSGTWTTGTIPLGTSEGCYFDVVLAPGPNTAEITAVWTNLGSHAPYYSIYNGGTWTTSAISLGSSSGSSSNVFISPGPTAGTLMAAWSDYINSVPYYSIYSGGTWNTSTIPLGASTTVAHDVLVAQDSNSGKVAAVWADATTKAIYFSIYSGGSWTSGSIPLGTSNGCLYNVYISSEATGELVATWSDSNTQVPYYSIYSEGIWSDGAAIPLSSSTGAHQNVAISRILNSNTMVATWGDVPYPNQPYYSFFIGAPIPPSELPPTDGKGKRVKNRFVLLVEWYNELRWKASLSSGIVGYNIRRNGVLIAEAVLDTFYRDYNRPKNGTDVYTVTSVFENGSESPEGLEIIVK